MKLIKLSSINLMISGYSYPERLDTVFDISYYLTNKIFYEVLSNEEQEEYKNKIVVRPSFDFDMSSTEYDATEGIINFYTSGWPQEKIPLILKAVKYFLGEVDVNVNDIVGPERSGIYDSDVYRIDVNILPKENKDNPPEINMSNKNAYDILRGLLNFDDSMSADAWQIISRIDKILPMQIDEYTSETTEDKGKGGSRFIEMGRDKEYIIQRLKDIRELAQWAIDHNYIKIYAV